MSTTRQALAQALDTVEGITAHPYITSDLEPGTAWVRLERLEYPNAFGGIAHYNLIVLLPQDLAEAEAFLEARIPALRAALAPELVLTSIALQRLDIPGVGILPCAFLNGHREAD